MDSEAQPDSEPRHDADPGPVVPEGVTLSHWKVPSQPLSGLGPGRAGGQVPIPPPVDSESLRLPVAPKSAPVLSAGRAICSMAGLLSHCSNPNREGGYVSFGGILAIYRY